MTHDISQVRRQFPIFARQLSDLPFHYLDTAAMAQIPQAVLDAQILHDSSARANVHRSLHLLAERADRAFENARAVVARHIHAASPSEIVFTSGTTASINLLAQALAPTLTAGDEIVVSELDHHSNFLPWLRLQQTVGIKLRVLPCDAESGRLDMTKLPALVGPRCRLITLPHASNVTGALTPLGPVVQAAKAVGALLALDGAQAIAHLPVNVQRLGVDFYCFSGHKVFGPTGIGVLWGKESVLEKLAPGPVGGGMLAHLDGEQAYFLPPPHRFEAGTPPVTQAIGLAAALTWFDDHDRKEEMERERTLTNRLLEGLNTLAGIRVIGPSEGDQRIALVSFAANRHHPHDICQLLAERGVAVRGGSLCAEPLMQALDLQGVVRASFSVYNDRQDVDALLEAIAHALKVLA